MTLRAISPQETVSEFERQLRSLPSIALGLVAEDMRRLINAAEQTLKRSRASTAGVDDALSFYRWCLREIEHESRRRDLGIGR